MYIIINESDYNTDLGLKFNTLKEAKERLKDIKRFDKEEGNPFNENYIIIKENLKNGEINRNKSK